MAWLIGILVSLIGAWLLLAVVVVFNRPDDASLREALQLLPDTLRLVRRLATDHRVPRTSRAMLWLLVAYLLSPLDLVPDFLPIIGFADDVVLVALVLRRVIRRSGSAVVAEQWPGTRPGLAALAKLAGIAS